MCRFDNKIKNPKFDVGTGKSRNFRCNINTLTNTFDFFLRSSICELARVDYFCRENTQQRASVFCIATQTWKMLKLLCAVTIYAVVLFGCRCFFLLVFLRQLGIYFFRCQFTTVFWNSKNNNNMLKCDEILRFLDIRRSFTYYLITRNDDFSLFQHGYAFKVSHLTNDINQ